MIYFGAPTRFTKGHGEAAVQSVRSANLTLTAHLVGVMGHAYLFPAVSGATKTHLTTYIGNIFKINCL